MLAVGTGGLLEWKNPDTKLYHFATSTTDDTDIEEDDFLQWYELAPG